MADPVPDQVIVDGVMQGSNSTTNDTKSISLVAGRTYWIFVGVNNFSAAGLTVECSGTGNTPTLVGSQNGAQVHQALWKMTAATTGTETLTANKNGNNGATGFLAIYGVSGGSGATDGAAVFGTNNNAAPPSVTMNATTIPNNLLLAVYFSFQPVTLTTPATGFSEDRDTLVGSYQYGAAQRSPNATGTFTAGWTTVTNSFNRSWVVAAVAVAGIPTIPVVDSLSDGSPAIGDSITITGSNFEASQGTGTVTIGGESQTVTSWSDTSIAITVSRGTLVKYGTQSLVVTNDTGDSSSGTTLTLLPPSGWAYVDLGTPNTTAPKRITATADLASGDQLAYETVGGLVVVYSDATFSYDPSVTEFDVEAWTPGDGWGATETQYIGNPSTYAPVVDEVSSASAAEGSPVVHTVTLSAATTEDTEYDLAFTDGTAVGGVDYDDTLTNSDFSDGVTIVGDVLTVPSGVSTFDISVPTYDDSTDEPSKTYTIAVGGVSGTGTITDNDPTPSLSINDVTVDEEAGTATFTVTLSAASGQTVTVGYDTADNTATAGVNYTAASGTLTFTAGQTSKPINVTILDADIVESKTFFVDLSDATNATIADAQGVGTITGGVPPPPPPPPVSNIERGRVAFGGWVAPDVSGPYLVDGGDPSATYKQMPSGLWLRSDGTGPYFRNVATGVAALITSIFRRAG